MGKGLGLGLGSGHLTASNVISKSPSRNGKRDGSLWFSSYYAPAPPSSSCLLCLHSTRAVSFAVCVFYVACFWARREIIIHTCDQPGGVGHWVLDAGRWVLVHSPVGGWVVDSKKMQLPKSSRQKESENEEQVDVVERLRCLFALIANGIFSRGSEGALKRGRRMWMWMWKWRTCTLQADQPHHHHPYLLHQHRQHREAGS